MNLGELVMSNEDQIDFAVMDLMLRGSSWHRWASQERGQSIKSIYIAIGRTAFRVIANGNLLYKGDNARVAVDCYNHAFADLENPIISPSSDKTKA